MLNKPFIKKISDFIVEKQLLHKDGKYIVTLSGGADSVTLLYVLKHLGYNIEAAHCNFKLRGDESDRDEKFCTDLCRNEGIRLHIVHFDTRSYAALHKISIEMAARNLRYAYFEQLRKDIGADGICVAHHRDDSVETLLLNLIRGTGLHGLKGISAVNGRIIRPMLCVSRAEIEDFLYTAGKTYVTDSTNLIDDVVRNKIRLDIIPMMKEINPSVCDNIFKTTQIVDDALNIIDSHVGKAYNETVHNDGNRLSICIGKLRKQISPEYTLFSILKEYGYTPAQTEQIYAATEGSSSGRRFFSKTHRLLIDRGNIIIEEKDDGEKKAMSMPESGTYIYNSHLKLRIEYVKRTPDFKITPAANHVYADASKLRFPLIIRNTVQGDRFCPFGMKGSKLVSNYLTDKKKPLFDKERQLVVEDATGRIVWLVNERADNRFRIADDTNDIVVISTV